MKVLLWLLLVLIAMPLRADYILTAPPRESLDDGLKVYGPLADYLSHVINEKVSYRHPNNWMEYQRDMRKGRYDIVFDGPHFVSWRMGNANHKVVARLPGTLEFYLVTYKSDKEINKIDHLVGKRFCGIAPPNLATMTILDRFPNPMRLPTLEETTGGFKGVLNDFLAGKCQAAVFRNTFYHKKIPNELKKKLRIVYHSKPLPNQAITLNKRFGEINIAKMVDALFSIEGQKHSEVIVNRFAGKKVHAFVKASTTEYAPYRSMLEDKLFGW